MATKDSLSSQLSTPKHALIVVPPTIKPSSTMILPKTATITHPTEKRSIASTDDCVYIRYERESSAINHDQIRFSYIIDEHSSLHKRSRFVSINDL